MNRDTENQATVAALLTSGTARMQALSMANLDAEVLLAHVLGQTRSWLKARPEQAVSVETAANFFALVDQRAAGIPVAYLTGTREFWSMNLTVNQHTLVPRPETELLVEVTLARAGKHDVIIELGTGSGAVALALASELPQAKITATDISRAALQVARSNAARLGLEVEFVHADWLNGFATGSADLIVSNPPYVAEHDHHLRSDGVRAEPRLALQAGSDGLQAIRHILRQARDCLRPGGSLILEHGHDQATRIGALMQQAGLSDVETFSDLAGTPRVTTARR